jgi:hypothetical protein
LRLALAIGTTLLCLTIGEVACRVRAHMENAHTLSNALTDRPVLSPDEPATLGDIIQISYDDRIAYELRPGMKDVSFKGATLSTNSLGFRSFEHPVEEPGNGVTIVGLGDSIMFGHGVADGETYLDRLAVILSNQYPDKTWRIINTGVPGYNTVMEVATLEEKTLAFGPDLVVVGLCSNDFGPPNYVRVEDDVWDTSRSFLTEWVAELRDPLAPSARYRSSALTFRRRWSDDDDSGEALAPPRYADLYGRQSALDALDRLAEFSEQEGFEVLALLIFEPTKVVPGKATPELTLVQACKQRGFHTLRMQAEITSFVEQAKGEFTWDQYLQTRLAVSPANGHPSAMLHSMAARNVYTYLKSSGVLDTLVGSD